LKPALRRSFVNGQAPITSNFMARAAVAGVLLSHSRFIGRQTIRFL
jgi:hypothetical protein